MIKAPTLLGSFYGNFLLDADEEGATILQTIGNFPATRRRMPRDMNVHQHRCANLRSHFVGFCWL